MTWIASLVRPFDGSIVTEREISPGVVVHVRKLPVLFGVGSRIREAMSTVVLRTHTHRIVII